MQIKKIIKKEFIGKNIEVIDAKNPSLLKLKGKIVDETKNTITIEKENGETKKLVKNQVTIKTTIEGKIYIIEGEILQGRPEERLKKKIKL